METIKWFLSVRLFGVCSRLGEHLGIASKRIRMFFIYSSFLTLGSPIFVYLTLAFVKEIRSYLKRGINRIWDL